MEINDGGMVIIKGDNIENGGLKIVHNYGVEGGEVNQKEKPLTEEELKAKVEFVKPKIIAKRLWFSVCKYMMWRRMVADGDFSSAVEIIERLFPDEKLDAKDLSSLNVDSFRKELDKWTPDDAPVGGKTYNKYHAIAELMYAV